MSKIKKMKTESETSTILQSNYIPIKKENVNSSKEKNSQLHTREVP